jgi:hypothetical protein
MAYTEDTRDEVPYPEWMESGDRYELDSQAAREQLAEYAHSTEVQQSLNHLAYNPSTERDETGGDEIEYADESDSV